MFANSTGSSCSETRAPVSRATRTAVLRVGRFVHVGFGVLALLSPLTAHAGELLRGRCHMGSCGWFSLEEKELVGSGPDGALFKATFKGWQSQHPDGNYDRKVSRKGGKPMVSYYFCSGTRPAVIVQVPGGGWQVDTLALNSPDGPPGVLEDTTATYYAVCHAVAADGPDAFARLGRHFGYPAMDEPPDAPTITKPADILKP